MFLCPFRCGHSKSLYLFKNIIPLSGRKVKKNPSNWPKISCVAEGNLGESLDFFGDFAYNSKEKEIAVCRAGASPLVSLRLGHAAALDATGIHSLPRRRFATPPNELIPASRAEKSSLESQKLLKTLLNIVF